MTDCKKKCPCCGSAEFVLLFDEMLDYEYRVPICPSLIECCSCGLIRHDKIPDMRELNRFYPKDYLVHIESFRVGSNMLFEMLKKILYKLRANKIHKILGSQGSVLDVGCANGAFLRSLKLYGQYELHGLDIKNTGIDFKEYGIIFREGVLEELEYPKNHFDAVVLDNLLEHVPEPKIFMDRVFSILKPGGYVFGTTPNFESLDRYLFGRYWGGFHMPRHISVFNPQNLRILLDASGFADIRFPITANAGNWAVSIQNYLRRSSDGKQSSRRGLYFPIIGMLFGPGIVYGCDNKLPLTRARKFNQHHSLPLS